MPRTAYKASVGNSLDFAKQFDELCYTNLNNFRGRELGLGGVSRVQYKGRAVKYEIRYQMQGRLNY
jgi:hypothetical protein